jgi:phospholipid-binding lipoprotein MlaA
MLSRHVSRRRAPLAWALAAALPLACALAGCATPPPASDPDAVADYNEANDPLEPTNRFFFKVNNGIDTVILRPLAVGYRYITTPGIRTGVANVLANIGSPVQLSDDILEAHPRKAGDTLMRFVINTTAGVGGIFDVAKEVGYPSHENDFGLVLATWGVGAGPFIYLPVLGPNSPRDAVGFGLDVAIDPFTWVGQGTVVQVLDYSRFAIGAVSAREALLDPIDQINKTALDPYATFRSLYRQNRASKIEQASTDRPATVPVWFSR